MININTIQEFLTETAQKTDRLTENTEINKIMEALICQIMGTEHASLWIHEENSRITRERAGSWINELLLDNHESLLYKCFATKKATIYNYVASERNYVASVDNPDDIKIKSKIMVPLVDDGRLIGIATAYSSINQIKKFNQDDLNLFMAIAPSLTSGICKMVANRSTHYPTANQRKSKSENESDFKRRKTDTMNNLQETEESRSETKTADEMLDYVANIVHDIRTPCNSLYGFLEILEEKTEDSRLKEYIMHAKESAEFVNELTTSILDGVSSKREASKAKAEKVSTFQFFAEIGEIFSANMYKKQIQYNIFIDPNLPREITIESMKLKRVILNLIGNAYKFTNKEHHIEFSVRYKEKRVHIFVKDDGIGIAAERQEKIFEAFEQAEKSTKSQYGGTGLGLSISAAYVKELGGKLSIESELEKGSRFYFDIPIEDTSSSNKFKTIDNKEASIAILMDSKNSFVANNIAKYLVALGIDIDKIYPHTDRNSINSDTTHLIVFENKLSDDLYDLAKAGNIKLLVMEENFLGLSSDDTKGALLVSQYTYYANILYTFIDLKSVPNVLIIDDDKISVSLIQSIFADELCDVSIAHNGVSGLEALTEALDENRAFDMVFLDSKMPLLSGEELLHKYRDIERKNSLSPIKAISISGEPYSDAKKDFDIFAGKPFDRKLILSIFNDIVKSA